MALHYHDSMNFAFILDVFFPPTCVYCAKQIRSGSLCDPCRENIVLKNVPPAKIAAGLADYWLGAATSYDNEIVRSLIHGLKFQFIKSAAEPLGQLLYEYASGHVLGANTDSANAIIVPVPLSKRRERVRGFNQSELIASVFADKARFPNVVRALTRIRHRKPQSCIKNIASREKNIKGCFAAHAEFCAGKNIILIDDVTTSGATFLEAARALRGAGARKITALAVARA